MTTNDERKLPKIYTEKQLVKYRSSRMRLHRIIFEGYVLQGYVQTPMRPNATLCERYTTPLTISYACGKNPYLFGENPEIP